MKVPKESVIRKMTRLALECDAVNLSQGFPDEPPDHDLVWESAIAMLGGTEDGMGHLEDLRVQVFSEGNGGSSQPTLLRDALRSSRGSIDQYNQYSTPYGLKELRESIARHVTAFRAVNVDPETEVTVVAGATEGIASALRAICESGDSVAIIQPFHEMYTMQCDLFWLKPRYVTLRESGDGSRWELDLAEMEDVLKGCRGLILNTPHNPTGKVFTAAELADIARLCDRHNVTIISDEIYEHIIFDESKHITSLTLELSREQVVMVSSLSKTGGVTGWRVGWVIASPSVTKRIRAVHDAMVIQAPTPLQRGAVSVLAREDAFYAALALEYQMRRELLSEVLKPHGFRLIAPEGAYYVFADYRGVPSLRDLDPTSEAMLLLDRCRVASVPGDNFYYERQADVPYLRFAFCRQAESILECGRRLDMGLT